MRNFYYQSLQQSGPLQHVTPKVVTKLPGTVEGMPDGKAIIATVNGSSLDTLAKADVKNGSFEFTGNVSEPTGAYIMVIGQRGAIPFC